MADDLRRPLRRRRIGDHLWALRPSPRAAASLILAVGAVGLGLWLASASRPWDGGPVVRVSVAPAGPARSSTAGGRGGRMGALQPLTGGPGLPSPEDVAADEALAALTDLVLPRTRPEPQGHEVMLQPPMEPFDYPLADPGPKTLRAGAAHQPAEALAVLARPPEKTAADERN